MVPPNFVVRFARIAALAAPEGYLQQNPLLWPKDFYPWYKPCILINNSSDLILSIAGCPAIIMALQIFTDLHAIQAKIIRVFARVAALTAPEGAPKHPLLWFKDFHPWYKSCILTDNSSDLSLSIAGCPASSKFGFGDFTDLYTTHANLFIHN